MKHDSGSRTPVLAAGLLLAAFLVAGCAALKGYRSQPESDIVADPGSFETAPPPPVVSWPYEDPADVPDGYRVVQRVQRLTFGAGSATLDTEARGALGNSVEDIREKYDWLLLVVGFADGAGERARGDALGRSRAESVRRFLESRGVDGARIAVMSLGSRYARADAYEPGQRSRDRAVEVWAFRAGG